VQYSCREKLDANGRVEVHASSGEESKAESKEEEAEGGEDEEEEFVTERKQPVPKWEVLAENRTVWEKLCKQLRLEAGSLG
jgi:hypothetical protein